MPPPQYQKALVLPAAFSDFTIEYASIPTPKVGQILVKNVAIALNPVDRHLQTSALGEQFLTFPAIIGLDLAGVVVRVGEGVDTVKEGDRVVAAGYWKEKDCGAFQEYTIATVRYASKIPANISFEEAASLPLTIISAATGLYQEGTLGAGLRAPWDDGGRGYYEGIPILITGGSSSLGNYAIQLAKLSGFSPIYTTASPKHTGYLQSLGATYIIDRSQSLTFALEGKQFSIIIDVASTLATQRASAALLAAGGTLVHMRAALEDFKLKVGASAKMPFGDPYHPENDTVGARLYGSLEKWMQAGDIRPNRIEVLPGGLRGITRGLDRLEAGTVSGVKLVVRPGETA